MTLAPKGAQNTIWLVTRPREETSSRVSLRTGLRTLRAQLMLKTNRPPPIRAWRRTSSTSAKQHCLNGRNTAATFCLILLPGRSPRGPHARWKRSLCEDEESNKNQADHMSAENLIITHQINRIRPSTWPFCSRAPWLSKHKEQPSIKMARSLQTRCPVPVPA